MLTDHDILKELTKQSSEQYKVNKQWNPEDTIKTDTVQAQVQTQILTQQNQEQQSQTSIKQDIERDSIESKQSKESKESKQPVVLAEEVIVAAGLEQREEIQLTQPSPIELINETSANDDDEIASIGPKGYSFVYLHKEKLREKLRVLLKKGCKSGEYIEFLIDGIEKDIIIEPIEILNR